MTEDGKSVQRQVRRTEETGKISVGATVVGAIEGAISNIDYIAMGFYPVIGGTETYVLEIAKRMPEFLTANRVCSFGTP